MYVCMYLNMYVSVWLYSSHGLARAGVPAGVYVCMYVSAWLYSCMYCTKETKDIFTHMHAKIKTHTHVYTPMYIHICAHT